MSDREKILRYFKASGEGELAARLLDLAEIVQKQRKYKVSDFLDPLGQSIAETIVNQLGQMKLVLSGGYEGAERCKAAFVHDDFMGKVDFAISAVSVTWDGRYYRLGHRDVLGSLIGLGLDREVLGDIILHGDSCQIIYDKSLHGFIFNNLVSIGAAAVSIEEIASEAIEPREQKVKEIRTTVPALRLDVVAAAGFGTSRTKMSDEIATAKVKLNWQDAKNSSVTVKPEDIISIRGRGRVEVEEVIGTTKKGRISIVLKRFI